MSFCHLTCFPKSAQLIMILYFLIGPFFCDSSRVSLRQLLSKTDRG